MNIFWIVISIIVVIELNSIGKEIRNTRFELRNLKDYLGQNGIVGELARIRELLTEEE